MAALPAPYRLSQKQDQRLREPQDENDALKQELAERVGSLEAELAALKAALSPEGQTLAQVRE